MLRVSAVLKTLFGLFVAIPVLLLLLVPFLGFLSIALMVRFAVWILARCFRRDLDGFLVDLNCAFALKNSNRATLNIVGTCVMKGELSKEQIAKCIEERVLSVHDPKTNAFPYERLQMSWEGFLGYAFWKRDKNFDLKNHLRLYDYGGKLRLPSPCTTSDLRKVLPGLANAPWNRSRSPWEILLIPNYVYKKDDGEDQGGKKSAFIVRVDHILGDGYSALLMLKEAAQSPFNIPEFEFAKREFSIWKKLGLLLKMPWDSFQMIVMLPFYTQLRHRSSLSKEDLIMSFSPEIDVSVVKKIKSHFGVGYATVIHAALFGAIGRALKDSGQRGPREILAGFILPMLKHPRGLSVNLTGMIAPWPITPCSPEENIRRVHKTLKSMSQSAAALAAPLLGYVSAYFPMFVRNLITKYASWRVSLVITNFPVTTGPDYFEGCEFLEVSPSLGPWSGLGMLVINAGVNNKQTISFSVNKSIFSSDAVASKLGTYVEQEIQAMLNATV